MSRLPLALALARRVLTRRARTRRCHQDLHANLVIPVRFPLKRGKEILQVESTSGESTSGEGKVGERLVMGGRGNTRAHVVVRDQGPVVEGG